MISEFRSELKVCLVDAAGPQATGTKERSVAARCANLVSACFCVSKFDFWCCSRVFSGFTATVMAV